MKIGGIATLGMGALALGGCATVESRRFDPALASEGNAYHLPRGEMNLTIVQTGGTIEVQLGGPVTQLDPDGLLVAKVPHGTISDNKVTLTVDPKTGLLSKVDVNSTGRLDDILKNAASSIGFFQASQQADGSVLFQARFTPGDAVEAQAAAIAANKFLAEHYAGNCRTSLRSNGRAFADELEAAGRKKDAADPALIDRLDLCRHLAEVGIDGTAQPQPQPISLLLEGGAIGPAPAAPLSDATRKGCARGICYRPFRSVTYTLKVRGRSQITQTFLTPDTDKLVFVDLRSGVFADQKYVLTFTDGTLTEMKQETQSEWVGAAALPLDIATAIMSAPTTALGLKQKRVEGETNYLTALESNLAAQEKVAATCRTDPNACPKTAYRLIRVPLGAAKDDAGTTVTIDDNGGTAGDPPPPGDGG